MLRGSYSNWCNTPRLSATLIYLYPSYRAVLALVLNVPAKPVPRSDGGSLYFVFASLALESGRKRRIISIFEISHQLQHTVSTMEHPFSPCTRLRDLAESKESLRLEDYSDQDDIESL
jgi:hypothetical protein